MGDTDVIGIVSNQSFNIGFSIYRTLGAQTTNKKYRQCYRYCRYFKLKISMSYQFKYWFRSITTLWSESSHHAVRYFIDSSSSEHDPIKRHWRCVCACTCGLKVKRNKMQRGNKMNHLSRNLPCHLLPERPYAQYTPPTPTRRNFASGSAVWTQFATSSRRLPTDSVDNLETGQS